jgi:hypothetical protein
MIYIFKPGGAVLASCVDVMVVLSCVAAGVFVVGWVTFRECCHTAKLAILCMPFGLFWFNKTDLI